MFNFFMVKILNVDYFYSVNVYGLHLQSQGAFYVVDEIAFQSDVLIDELLYPGNVNRKNSNLESSLPTQKTIMAVFNPRRNPNINSKNERENIDSGR